MPVHAKEPAQKMHTQGLSLRCGPYHIPVVPEPHFTPIAQYRQHQCIKTTCRCGGTCQVDLSILFMTFSACSRDSPEAAYT